MRKFIITWYDRKSYVRIDRKTKITVNIDGDIGKVAKAATEVFARTCGSLLYNEIVEIQEIDDNGNPIGEPILPVEDTSIVPTAK